METHRHGSEADNECLHYVLFEVIECVLGLGFRVLGLGFEVNSCVCYE